MNYELQILHNCSFILRIFYVTLIEMLVRIDKNGLFWHISHVIINRVIEYIYSGAQFQPYHFCSKLNAKRLTLDS